MTFAIAIDALGGIALFLFAMLLMTEGLNAFAGAGLRQLLARSTATPWRGVLLGILVTGVVQSSSAVTVATIGFVNAGLLTLRQALGVIFGTNVGTTMTGWLVSLVGFGVKIEALALPIVTVGVALRLLAPRRREKGLGEALVGFGLFFLGLSVLRDAFDGVAASFGADVAAGRLGGSWPVFVLVGIVATVLTQSSSASIAILLTAAQRGVVAFDAAAAAVIGANVGTTATAALAVLKATPAAKRLALGHIAFNGLTAIVALLLLPLLLRLVSGIGDGLDLEGNPAALLALFHTTFNVLGVALMLPLAGRLAVLLERLFRAAEEDLARPRHLDRTLAGTPALAVAAVRAELLRLEGIVAGLLHSALAGTLPLADLQQRAAAARTLGEAVAEFVAAARTGVTPRETAGELSGALFAHRYLHEVAGLLPQARELADAIHGLPAGECRTAIEALRGAAERAAAHFDPAAGQASEFDPDLLEVQRAYDAAKPVLIGAAVQGRLAIPATDHLLDLLRATRRALRQLAKASRALHGARMAEAAIANGPDGGSA